MAIRSRTINMAITEATAHMANTANMVSIQNMVSMVIRAMPNTVIISISRMRMTNQQADSQKIEYYWGAL